MLIAALVTWLAPCGCKDSSTAPPSGGSTKPLTISSDVFKEGETVPEDAVYNKSGCSGKNHSPNVKIDPASIPTETKSFAVLLHDPDAPMSGGFYHWVLFNVPPSTKTIEGGQGASDKLADGSTQGTNDFDERGYDGPCPPPGKPHHYKLTVYALDVPLLGLDSSARGGDAARALKTHILAAGTITATYGR
jgi:Raf kinase inhibitor-like YbhB/YbcL family protein